jgi:hemerythrin-like domain-containing protein
MNIITDFMGQDHDQLDQLFSAFRSKKASDVARAIHFFSEFKRGLQRHIIWEEEFLFPCFESRTGLLDEGPTAVMRLEHRRIKSLLDKIHDDVANGKTDTDDLEGELANVLLVHNTKEESVLYPSIDQCLSEQEATELIEAMNTLPADRYVHCCTEAR